MWFQLRRWLPELGLTALTLFFVFRELGTFPTAWSDDSLFMIVAKNLATGHGYTLPVLHDTWRSPYILAVGPTLIGPVALSMKLFGMTVVAARLPMALFLLLTTIVTYAYTLQIADRFAARFSTLLLITLSAFVNTGKPVLGEIPGFFFLLLGLFLLFRFPSSRRVFATAGLCFGLSVITKLPYGLTFIALGLTWILLAIQRKWHALLLVTICITAGLATFLLLGPFLGITDPGFLRELNQYAVAEGGSELLRVLRANPTLLLRLPFLAFGCIAILGIAGLWSQHKKLPQHVWLTTIFLITLFILYFMNNSGWYRHLLPAHLLLLPFVPIGAHHLFGQRVAAVVLTLIALPQGLWQLDHRGSTRNNESVFAAGVLVKNYADTTLVILHPELFVLLPENPHWLFLSEELQWRKYERFGNLSLTQEQHCLPLVQKLNDDQQKEFSGRTEKISGRYHIIQPPPSCKKRGE